MEAVKEATIEAVGDDEAQRDKILATMRELALAPPEPGEVQVGDVVHRGTADFDTQMMVSTLKGAPIVYIWDSRTGQRSRTSANMLQSQLSKRREDGSTVFTRFDPHIAVVRGQLKCLLHPELPQYAGQSE